MQLTLPPESRPLERLGARLTQAKLRGIVADAKQMFDAAIMPSFYLGNGVTRLGAASTGAGCQSEVTPLLTARTAEDAVAYRMTRTDS